MNVGVNLFWGHATFAVRNLEEKVTRKEDRTESKVSRMAFDPGHRQGATYQLVHIVRLSVSVLRLEPLPRTSPTAPHPDDKPEARCRQWVEIEGCGQGAVGGGAAIGFQREAGRGGYG